MSIFNDTEFPPLATSSSGRKNAVAMPEKEKKGTIAATPSSSPPLPQRQQHPTVSEQFVKQPPPKYQEPPHQPAVFPSQSVPPHMSSSSAFASYNYYAQQPPPYQYQQQMQPMQPSGFSNATLPMPPPQLPYPVYYYQHPVIAAAAPPLQFDADTQRRRNKLGLIIFLANCEALHEIYSRQTTKTISNTELMAFHCIANLAIVLSKTYIGTDDPHITQLSRTLFHSRGVPDVRETVTKRHFIASIEENAYGFADTREENLVSRTISWLVSIYIADEIDKATVPKILEFVLSIR